MLSTEEIAVQILDGSAPLAVVVAAYCADRRVNRRELGGRAGVGRSSTYAALQDVRPRSAAKLARFLGYSGGAPARTSTAARLARRLADEGLTLRAAVATWCAANGLREGDMGELMGRSSTAWSSAKHRGGPTPGLEAAVRGLIGYGAGP